MIVMLPEFEKKIISRTTRYVQVTIIQAFEMSCALSSVLCKTKGKTNDISIILCSHNFCPESKSVIIAYLVLVCNI